MFDFLSEGQKLIVLVASGGVMLFAAEQLFMSVRRR